MPSSCLDVPVGVVAVCFTDVDGCDHAAPCGCPPSSPDVVPRAGPRHSERYALGTGQDEAVPARRPDYLVVSVRNLGPPRPPLRNRRAEERCGLTTVSTDVVEVGTPFRRCCAHGMMLTDSRVPTAVVHSPSCGLP